MDLTSIKQSAFLQEIDGTFNLKFFGIPVKYLGGLICVSKCELDAVHSVAHIYSIHITPFFSFTFTLPRNK